MVDLVKIRKKAKKKDDEPAAETPASSAPLPPQPAHAPSPAPAPPDHVHEHTAPPATARQPEHPATTSEASKLERFVEEAGHRRELSQVQGGAAEQQQELLELLTFTIAGEQYAVNIEHIVEIVTPRPITRIPNADASVLGIISLRGTIVTILDVRRKLRHPPSTAEDGDSRVIVLEHRGETLGFQVDRVWRVVKVAPGDIEPHPVVHASELSESIRGVFRQPNALTILLDFDKLLDGRLQRAAS